MSLTKEFDDYASFYDQAAVLPQTVGKQLLERLNLFPYLKVNSFLDIGCGTGFCLAELQKKYLHADAVGLDLSWECLRQARKKTKRWFRKSALLVAGDIEQHPFAYDQFDLIFANLSLLWTQNLDKVLTELFQLLKNNGLLLFTGLGPRTFKEYLHVPFVQQNNIYPFGFCDIHTFGNTLNRCHFKDVVLDTEYFKLLYHDDLQFLNELKYQGLHTLFSIDPSDASRVDTRTPFESTYEVIYGQAWKLASVQSKNNTPSKPLDSIPIFRAPLINEKSYQLDL